MTENSMISSRRGFLKSSAVVVAAAGSMPGSKLLARTNAWSAGTPVNPNISDTRVVYCQDDSMIVNQYPNMGVFDDQNDALDSAKIKQNMDYMARTLAEGSTFDESWGTIFQRPSGKTWGECKVYIKVNGADSPTMPHLPIVSKVCEELIKLGVQASSIQIADPSRNACKPHNSEYGSAEKYDQYAGGNGLPVGVVVRDEEYADLSGHVRTNDKVNFHTWQGPDGGVDLYGTKALVDWVGGQLTYMADIVVNIAVSKGHGKKYMGGCTMTMKNHIGSFAIGTQNCPGKPYDPNQPTGYPDMLIDMTKHEVLMGGGTAEYPCRQQLCICDSIWAAVGGPHDHFDRAPGFIVMGTCSPCVDWLVSDKIRRAIMGAWDWDDTGVLGQFLQSFNHSTSDPQWIPMDTAPVASSSPRGNGRGRMVSVVLTGDARGESLRFRLPGDAIRHGNVRIYDVNGSLVRDLGGIGSDRIAWDGRNGAGRTVAGGLYVVRVTYGNRTFTKPISVFG